MNVSEILENNNVIVKGLIFDLQKFSLHDGPGIRTTVFMKGCPLRCQWCSNPESKNFFPELIARDINCKRCGACLRVCPNGAIKILKNARRKIDRKKCKSCLLCADSCIYGALKRCGQYMTAQEVLSEVIQDKIFYKNSGGGVTLSGGEPLFQGEFAANFLAECKREGLHTVLETSGHCPWREMEKSLEYVDLILFDIKHLNSTIHKKTTGINNSLILKNLQSASKKNKIWLRVPLIAEFNDSEEHIRQVAALGSYIGAEKISLLPYHEGGKKKSEQLGKMYKFNNRKPPDGEYIQRLKSIVEKVGIIVTIGY